LVKRKIEHLISEKFRHFQPLRLAGRLRLKTRREPSQLQKIVYPETVTDSDCRRAIADRVSNVQKFTPKYPPDRRREAGAIRAITPSSGRVSSFHPDQPTFSEVFTLFPGLTSRHSLAYGNADAAATAGIRADRYRSQEDRQMGTIAALVPDTVPTE
jgi:hypothetical protein